MPNLVGNAHYRVSLRWKYLDLHDLMVVHHFKMLADVTRTEAQIKTDLEAYFQPIYGTLAGQISSSAHEFDMKVDRVAWDAGTAKEIIVEPIYLGPFNLTNPPAGTGETLPLQDASVITLRTARPKSRGRKFIPALVESVSAEGGQIASGHIGNHLTAAANMLLTITFGAATAEHGIFSHAPGVAGTFYKFLAAAVSSRICTQRKRRVGVGQ